MMIYEKLTAAETIKKAMASNIGLAQEMNYDYLEMMIDFEEHVVDSYNYYDDGEKEVTMVINMKKIDSFPKCYIIEAFEYLEEAVEKYLAEGQEVEHASLELSLVASTINELAHFIDFNSIPTHVGVNGLPVTVTLDIQEEEQDLDSIVA